MTTTLTYNGVVFQNCLTERFDDKMVYDETGVNLIGREVELTVKALLTSPIALATGTQWIGETGKPVTGLASVHFLRMEQLLKTPRKDLRFTVDGVDIVIANDARKLSDPHRDVHNGPLPQNVEITAINGDTYWVRFTIRVRKAPCDSDAVPFVLSNRWSVAEMLDSNFYMTRTISGRLVLSTSEQSAHLAKKLCVPLLEAGFRREEITFVVAADGLSADYTVTDRQVHTAAPWPATAMSGTHTESTEDGITSISECNVKLTGAPNSSKTLLFQRAQQIIDARLNFLKLRQKKQAWIVGYAMVDYLGAENMIEVRMRIRHRGALAGDVLAKVFAETLGKPLALPKLQGVEYDPIESTPPYVWGYESQGKDRDPKVVTALLTCYLKDPCSDDVGIQQVLPKKRPIPDLKYWQSTSLGVAQLPGPLPADQDKGYNQSESHQTAMYLYCRAESKYRTSMTRVACPLAGNLQDRKPEDPTVKIFDVGLPTTQRVMVYDIERMGDPPEIPQAADTYTDGKITGTLLDVVITAAPPMPTADGRDVVHRIRAEYVYALSRPPTAQEKLRVGVLPFTTFSLEIASLDSSKIYNPKIGP